MSMGFQAGRDVPMPPFVPSTGPERPSSRAQLNALLRRRAADRVRPRSPIAAAEIENPNTQLAELWRAASLARVRDERVASVRRQIAAERAAEEFADRRGAFRMAQDRARHRARGSGGEDIRGR